jgi:hypothetical protein
MKSARLATHVVSAGVIVLLALSAFFFWLWYERYLRLEFNELGRYYDATNQIVYTDAGFVWCLPAFGFLLWALATVAARLWRRRANQAFKR